MKTLKMPDVTAAQVLAVVKFAVTQAVALAFLTPGNGRLVLQAAGTLIPMTWVIADAIIRHGRSQVAREQVYRETHLADIAAAAPAAPLPSAPPPAPTS